MSVVEVNDEVVGMIKRDGISVKHYCVDCAQERDIWCDGVMTQDTLDKAQWTKTGDKMYCDSCGCLIYTSIERIRSELNKALTKEK